MAPIDVSKCRGQVEITGGAFKVVFLHQGQENEVHPLLSAEEASLACDVLAVKEALDAQQALGDLPVHTHQGSPSPQLAGLDLTGTQVAGITFQRLVQQLQGCALHLQSQPGVRSDSQPAGGTLLLWNCC